jgi:hypothetical protein
MLLINCWLGSGTARFLRLRLGDVDFLRDIKVTFIKGIRQRIIKYTPHAMSIIIRILKATSIAALAQSWRPGIERLNGQSISPLDPDPEIETSTGSQGLNSWPSAIIIWSIDAVQRDVPTTAVIVHSSDNWQKTGNVEEGESLWIRVGEHSKTTSSSAQVQAMVADTTGDASDIVPCWPDEAPRAITGKIRELHIALDGGLTREKPEKVRDIPTFGILEATDLQISWFPAAVINPPAKSIWSLRGGGSRPQDAGSVESQGNGSEKLLPSASLQRASPHRDWLPAAGACM